MSATTRVRDLANAKLSGRKIDVVGFVDELLAIVAEVGAVRCCLGSEDSLVFELGGGETCDVELDACRGKLRMVCARVCALCNESGGGAMSPYGGDGVIRVPPLNGKGPIQWTVRFKNTPAEHEFSITAKNSEKAQVSAASPF